MQYKKIFLHQVKEQDIPLILHPYLIKKYLKKLRLKNTTDTNKLLIVPNLQKKDSILNQFNLIKLDVPFSIRSYLQYVIENKKTEHNYYFHNEKIVYPTYIKNTFMTSKDKGEKNTSKNQQLSITEIIKKITNDPEVQNFIYNPSGKCFDSANYIGNILKSYGVKEEYIKYRLCQITRPGMAWVDVNRDNNENHMATLLIHERDTYVFDPTIIQFIGIKEPFFGNELSWLEAMKPAWNGYVIKKAIQYIDYNTYDGADNASIKYRINFDEMTKKGGIFINYPEWYKKHYKRYNKKNKSLFSCLKSKVKE